MNHIETMTRMMNDGLTVVTNPSVLKSELADKTSEEIRTMRQGDGQLTPQAQHEMSLRGDRCAFVEFHRFMFGLSDVDVKRLWNAKKQFTADNYDEGFTYCDVNLLIDATQYQLCIRDARGFDQITADEIAKSFRFNAKSANDFPEITSQHMITFAQKMMADYTQKGANFQKARGLLGLTQAALSEKLGWSTVKQVSNIETGARPVQKQTELAVECLLRRAKKLNIYRASLN